jgi:hypothetical protein
MMRRLLLLVPAVLLLASPLEGQRGVRDLVLTSGVSLEGYQGNLQSAGAAVQDSTDRVGALVGEIGFRGDAFWRLGDRTRSTLFFDGGTRQFGAWGFREQDYSPREWVGVVEGALLHSVGQESLLRSHVSYRGRGVEDRPPMPLFLQPGYGALSGGVAFQTRGGGWELLELSVVREETDYSAPEFAPQIRLLDRESTTLQLSLARGRPADTGGALEGFVALDLSRYPSQETFNPDDPNRRDRTLRGRIGWRYDGSVLLRTGVEGRLNRSNSRRPEYGSLTVDAQLSTEVPGGAIATAYVVLTGKEYRDEIPFSRLLPGEEANSASLAYLSLSREITREMSGAVRLGWTRAETETGGDYFQRMGVSFLLTYRPFR